MCVVSSLYKKKFLIRYDKDPAIPYFSYEDFPGLKMEKNSFINSLGIKIAYFYYNYENYNKDKLIIFCHGIGPGHTAYLSEIEKICKQGYQVLTFDYLGCGESEGSWMISSNRPAKDLIELITRELFIQKEIILVGHSLGAYTSLVVANKLDFIHKAVIISGFLNVTDVLRNAVKTRLLTLSVGAYEKRMSKGLFDRSNKKYLKNTSNKLLFIHSKDDQIVNYNMTIKTIEKLQNPNISIISVNNRRHNPNYSDDASNYMFQVFNEYQRLINDGTLKTIEDRQKFFLDKSLKRMTEQDDEIFSSIFEFIEK